MTPIPSWWMLLSAIALFIGGITASSSNNNWNTLYAYVDGRIYIHLKNNDLLALNFSIAGFSGSSNGLSVTDIDLTNNQQVETLPSPPENATLFLFNEELYGLIGVKTNSKLDVCGEGIIQLLKFDSTQKMWSQVHANLNFNNINDASYYQHATVLTTPTDTDTVYLYGGICDSQHGIVSNRLLSFNMSSYEFVNITTSTKPEAFYGAGNLLAPNPQTQLVIGGQSNQGWLNMYQLATWDFSSGWSFKQINKDGNDPTMNSRTFPLILPIFSQLSNNTIEAVSNFLSIQEVLLIGGDLLGEESTPQYAKLSTSSNDWSWNTTFNVTWDYSEILGAATIFNTLVIINSTSEGNSKRDGSGSSYSVSLYDTNTFASVTSVKSNTTQQAASSFKHSVSKKAILGTVIPLVVIAIVVAAVIFYTRRRKRQQQQDELNALDYQIGNYFDRESMVSNKNSTRHNLLPTDYTSSKVMDLNNDSSSTLEDQASFDSWIRKRQEFDQTRLKTRNSYMASNETLFNNNMNRSSTSEEDYHATDTHHGATITNSNGSINSYTLMNRSVSRLKKSFSFNSAPGSPTSGEYGLLKKKRSTGLLRKSSEQSFVSENSPEMAVKERSDMIAEETDHESIDDQDMDVQVLVSSKRRSVLKVMNPDMGETSLDQTPEDNEDDNTEIDLSSRYDETVEIRQRVPSGGKTEDD
ncbi:predicted protein [Scheffersomyces stipitis CBS 6054]|uniref:Uncharacterized protein n=1 Tax=Scheffersomyces stipitis (strain ATCC 58785 / CBS 6054 / NBRC 10063 / NRRL Y-11545) TaxID=322104 RepID=A3LYY1_PICST|nr:predicted protein [Scheffersomyces stipitis CBS 6054]ABN68059.2 predicted protein [Scheffersomyces stipitis CBS 6054]